MRPSASATETLARWVVGLRADAIPATTTAYAADLLLDHLGCAARGSTTDTAESVRDLLDQLDARTGTTQTALVGGGSARAEWAAFANGVAAHSVELDDTHSASSLHPGVVVIPAALAVAEQVAPDGPALLAAIVAGYEVACRIGRALDAATCYATGFHPTAIVGPFAAAAAAGRLLGLTAPQLVDAFGICASTASGRLEFLADGAWTKRFHPGWAAVGGLTAARLARAGFSGPRCALDGRDGLLRAYGAADRVELATTGLGEPFELARTSIKPYACCRYNQGPIDLAIGLARDHALAADDIADVEVGVVSAAIGMVVEPAARKVAPTNDVDAQFSLPWSVALGLVRRRAGLDDYATTALGDPDVLRVAGRVRAAVRPDFDARFPERWSAAVTVRTTDGRTLSAETGSPLGDPDNPLPARELRAKFRDLAGAAYAPADLDAIEAGVAALAADGPAALHAALRGATS